eukprot:m51a1_g649 hypothetical protein (893) ;mRNA; f:197389-201223
MGSPETGADGLTHDSTASKLFGDPLAAILAHEGRASSGIPCIPVLVSVFTASEDPEGDREALSKLAVSCRRAFRDHQPLPLSSASPHDAALLLRLFFFKCPDTLLLSPAAPLSDIAKVEGLEERRRAYTRAASDVPKPSWSVALAMSAFFRSSIASAKDKNALAHAMCRGDFTSLKALVREQETKIRQLEADKLRLEQNNKELEAQLILLRKENEQLKKPPSKPPVSPETPSAVERAFQQKITAKPKDSGFNEGDLRMIKTVQLVWRCRKASKELHKRAQNHIMRFKVASELAMTEATFLQSLNLIKTAFWVPSKAVSKAADEIFGGTELIEEFSSRLLDGLRERVFHWSQSQCVGDVMFKHSSDFLRSFQNFVSTFELRVATLKREREKKQFNDVICKKHNLDSILITPVQRGPRYVLLLRELLRYTPKEHRDRPLLQDALDSFESAMRKINNSSSQTVVELNSQRGKIAGVALQPDEGTKKFVREGPAMQQLKGSALRKVYMYAFSDVVIIAEQLPQFRRLLKHKMSCLDTIHLKRVDKYTMTTGNGRASDLAGLLLEDLENERHMFGFTNSTQSAYRPPLRFVAVARAMLEEAEAAAAVSATAAADALEYRERMSLFEYNTRLVLDEQRQRVRALEQDLADAQAHMAELEAAHHDAWVCESQAAEHQQLVAVEAQRLAARKAEAHAALQSSCEHVASFRRALATRSLASFGVGDVAWLLLESGHAGAVDAFADQAIDGAALRELRGEELEKLGLATLQERVSLLHALRTVEACGELDVPDAMIVSLVEDLRAKRSIEAAECSLWSSEKVAEWLGRRGVARETVDKIKGADVTGKALLFLEERDLEAMGVQALGERKKLEKMFRELSDSHFRALSTMFGSLITATSTAIQ